MLRNLDFKSFKISLNNITSFWHDISDLKIGTDNFKFPNFIFNVLCLPHSSANVERIFSRINLNKTKTRNRLKYDTLEGILYTKSLVSSSGKCYNFKIGNNLIKKLNSKILYTTGQEKEDDSDSSD